MTSPRTAPLHNNGESMPKSRYQTTVSLDDWWLVKAENDSQGTRITIAGHTVRGKQARRYFSSLPILKRHDESRLETTDGICVILKGFVNKSRSAENGFPSEVCTHFMSGFPSYWKGYAEKCMIKESPAAKSDQPQVSGLCNNNLESQDTMDGESIKKNKRTRSSADPLLEKTDTVINAPESISSTSCIASGGKENCLEASVVEDCTTLDTSVEPLTTSSTGEKINLTASPNEDVDDSQIHESGGSLSPFNICTRSRSCKANDSPRKSKLGQKSSIKISFTEGLNLLEEIPGHTKDKMKMLSATRTKVKQKNDQTSATVIRDETLSSNSVSSYMGSKKVELVCVVTEPGGGDNLPFEFTELDGSNDKMNWNELDAGTTKDKVDQLSETPDQEKGLKKVKTKNKFNDKPRSRSTRAAANGKKQAAMTVADKSSFSENAKEPYMNTRRKLAYETPETNKGKASIDTPESLSFKRSRSGRLLMPPLDFWRNQRAVYSADRTVTGIEDETQLEQPRKSNVATPRRK